MSRWGAVAQPRQQPSRIQGSLVREAFWRERPEWVAGAGRFSLSSTPSSDQASLQAELWLSLEMVTWP